MKSRIHIIAETERLVVRLPVEADVPVLAKMWTDERVTRFMGGPREFEKVCASLREGLAVPPEKFDLWAVMEKSSGRIIGHCGLLPKKIEGRDEVELIYVIASDFWGRGYASEAATAIRDYAFQIITVARLVALIDPTNSGSERVALKLGMKHEADTVRESGKTMKVYAINAGTKRHP